MPESLPKRQLSVQPKMITQPSVIAERAGSHLNLPTLSTLIHSPGLQARWRLLWALLVLVVGVVTLMPGEAAPSLSSNDKFDHLLGFCALAVAGALSSVAGWRHGALVACSMVAYGGFIELAQTQVPGRFGDWADFRADALGVLLGLALVFVLRRLLPAPGA